MKYMGQGSNVVVLFTCMCSYGCFSSCKIGFVISSVRLRHSSFEQDLVDKSIIFYPKVFPLTNSSSWICWSSARRSRKRCIQATLVTTSSKQSFVSRLTCSPRLTIIITMVTSADTKQAPFDVRTMKIKSDQNILKPMPGRVLILAQTI